MSEISISGSQFWVWSFLHFEIYLEFRVLNLGFITKLFLTCGRLYQGDK